jgi:hypothetical protein
MRPEQGPELAKVTEIERKNMKKRLMFKDFD